MIRQTRQAACQERSVPVPARLDDLACNDRGHLCRAVPAGDTGRNFGATRATTAAADVSADANAIRERVLCIYRRLSRSPPLNWWIRRQCDRGDAWIILARRSMRRSTGSLPFHSTDSSSRRGFRGARHSAGGRAASGIAGCTPLKEGVLEPNCWKGRVWSPKA
jgi:hypothetical protein